MNILVISREYPPNTLGGTATLTKNIHKGLEKLGNNVYVVTTTTNLSKIYEKNVYAIKVEKLYQNSNQISIDYLKKIQNIIKKYKPDCMIVPDLFSFSEAFLMSKREAIPLIFVCSQDFRSQSEFNRGIHYVTKNIGTNVDYLIEFEKSVFKRCEAIVYVSESLRKDMIDLNPFCLNKVIHLGADRDYLETFNNIDYKKDVELISTCARLVPEKGVKYLIQAMPIILKNNSKIKLSIIGTGTEDKELMDLVKKLSIKDSVTFHGHIEHEKALKIMKKSQVGVVTSLWESFCYVAVEYMGLGTNLVSTDAKSLKEICPPNLVSIVKPSQNKSNKINVDFLAQCIIDKLKENVTNNERRIEAQKYVYEELSNEKFSLKLEKFVEEVIMSNE